MSEAEATTITAAERPNPSISASVGGETAEFPFIAGLGLSVPIETAGKRKHRITEAEPAVDAARWSAAAAAWRARSDVRTALLEYVAAERSADLLRAEERLRSEQVALFEQRLAVGMISRPEVDTARIAQTQTQVALKAAEGRISLARAEPGDNMPTTASGACG